MNKEWPPLPKPKRYSRRSYTLGNVLDIFIILLTVAGFISFGWFLNSCADKDAKECLAKGGHPYTISPYNIGCDK